MYVESELRKTKIAFVEILFLWTFSQQTNKKKKYGGSKATILGIETYYQFQNVSNHFPDGNLSVFYRYCDIVIR